MRQLRKRVILSGVLCICVLLLMVFGAKIHWATVTLSWTYDYDKNSPCSATRTTNCIDHFEVEDITGAPILLQSVPNPSSPSGVINITTTFKLGPSYGERTMSVIAVGKDGSGKRVTSNESAAKVTVAIRSRALHSCYF